MTSTTTSHQVDRTTKVKRQLLFIEPPDSEGDSRGMTLRRFPRQRDEELCVALRRFAPEVTYEDLGHVGPR